MRWITIIGVLFLANAAMAGREDVVAPAGCLWEVVAIEVAIGQFVDKDAVVAILRAMKMQINIKANQAGRVAAILVQPGSIVDGSAPLVAIDK